MSEGTVIKSGGLTLNTDDFLSLAQPCSLTRRTWVQSDQMVSGEALHTSGDADGC